MAKAIEQDDGDDVQGGKRARFPTVDLEEAVRRVKMLYDADKQAGSAADAAVVHMGYSGRSGPANQLLASLKRFGLITRTDGRVFPTQRAVAICILPPDDARRRTALQAAVVTPELYRQLIEQYAQSGLPSAETLRQELILSDRVNHDAADSVVKNFLESLKYAGLSDVRGVGSSAGDQQGVTKPTVGSFVQWTSGGAGRSAAPQKVVGLSDDNAFVFVEGHPEGIRMSDVTVVDTSPPLTGADRTAPPMNPFYRPSGGDAFSEKPGFELERANIAEGVVLFQWPDKLSEASYEELEYWIKGLLMRGKRKAGIKEQEKGKPAEAEGK